MMTSSNDDKSDICQFFIKTYPVSSIQYMYKTLPAQVKLRVVEAFVQFGAKYPQSPKLRAKIHRK